MAKMMVPETETPKQDLNELDNSEEKPVNVIDAAAGGALNGMQLAMNVGAMLLAFVALIALSNGLVGWIGGWFDNPDLTIQQISAIVLTRNSKPRL